MYTKVEHFRVTCVSRWRWESSLILARIQHHTLALWKMAQTSGFKDNKLRPMFFVMCRSSHSSSVEIPDNAYEEPAAYWSAPREHLSLSPVFQQQVVYRGLSPRSLENAYVHEFNGDSFNMLVELAVDMPYAISSNTPSPASHQPTSSPSSSPSSSVPSVSPSLEEPLN